MLVCFKWRTFVHNCFSCYVTKILLELSCLSNICIIPWNLTRQWLTTSRLSHKTCLILFPHSLQISFSFFGFSSYLIYIFMYLIVQYVVFVTYTVWYPSVLLKSWWCMTCMRWAWDAITFTLIHKMYFVFNPVKLTKNKFLGDFCSDISAVISCHEGPSPLWSASTRRQN